MKLRNKPKVFQKILCIVTFVFMIAVTSLLLKFDFTNTVFGVIKQPAPAPVSQYSNPAEVPVVQERPQGDQSGYRRYIDSKGDEVIIVPAGYVAKPESTPVQSAPDVLRQAQQKNVHLTTSQESPPQVSQHASPARMTPVQAAPPVNLSLMAMNAAYAHTGMNVLESCRCNNSLATKGDSKDEVLIKCAEPVYRQGTNRTDCREIWLYNFGPNEFMQGICFDRDRVTKVLSLDRGY